MKQLAKSENATKKEKMLLKKVKRFSNSLIKPKSKDLSSSVDIDAYVSTNTSRKKVKSPHSIDDKLSPVLATSEQKTLITKRKSRGKWEISELTPTQSVKNLQLENDVVTGKVITKEKKLNLSVKKTLKCERTATENKKKANKIRKKEFNVKSGTNTETSLDYSSIRDNVPAAGSDVNFFPCGDYLVNSEEVEKAVKALLQLIKVTAEKRGPSLFENEAEPVHMQITSVRVPITPMRRIRFSLPHPMLTDTSDVCLFVPDLKKGARIDHEPTVTHYRELLEKYGIKGITQIMPVRQLKDEYSQYEMRRRLCNSFDIFLADGRICGPINPLLGKEFQIKKKLPTPVNLQSKHLKEAIEHALSKTALTVSSRGDSTLVKIGHSHHTPQQLTDNIMHVIEEMKTRFPGGWQNIRALNLKTSRSLRIPFYVTMKPANSVKVPVIKPKRPKAAVPVEDELSTIPGARVVVMPSGEVIVKKESAINDISSTESEWESQNENGNEDEGSVENRATETEKKKTKKKDKNGISKKRKAAADSDEGDTEVEAAEEEYLSGWLQEFQESEKTKEEMKKPAKKKSKLQNDLGKNRKKKKS